MLTFTNIHGYSNVVELHSDDKIMGTGEIIMSKEVKDGLEKGLLFVKTTSNPKVFTETAMCGLLESDVLITLLDKIL